MLVVVAQAIAYPMYVGQSQVGGEVARRARGLGMHVVAYDPYASEEKARAVGVTLVSFDEALATGDFFSLHMPLTPGTCGCRRSN